MQNTVSEKTQLSNGVWVVPNGDNSWGGEINDNFVLLNGLLNRHTLSIHKNGDLLCEYNNTADVDIDVGQTFTTDADIDALFGE